MTADELSSRYKKLGGINDLNEAIVLTREALSLCPPGHLCHVKTLKSLAVHLNTRYKQLEEIEDLKEVVNLSRETLSLYPPGDPDRSDPLNNLAAYLTLLYEQLRAIEDLNEVIGLCREILPLYPPGHPGHATASMNLANWLFSRYEELGAIDDLNEAIDLTSEALSLYPPSHPHRSASLTKLATCLSFRHEQLGEIDDLNKAIVLDREVLSLHPPGHPDHPWFLSNLSTRLSSRYEQLGKLDDLNEAIVLGRKALSPFPPGHSERSTSLLSLATALSLKYQQFGAIDDLNEAIVLAQEHLSYFPPGHPSRSTSLIKLANHLSVRYKQRGGIDYLNEAIVLHREALSLCPPGHPQRLISLGNLAIDLASRYTQLGGVDDLNEAVLLDRESLSLCPPGRHDRSKYVGHLSLVLFFRYKQFRLIDDLAGAIVLGQEQLSLCPPGHPLRSMALQNHATFLFSRHELLGGIDDLSEIIFLSREALSLCSHDYPARSIILNNLALCLSSRHRLLGGIDDLHEALGLFRETLSLCPRGHPERSAFLDNFAKHLLYRYRHPKVIDDAEDLQRELFALYAELEHVSQTVSTDDLLAARAWVDTAEEFHHPTVLSAYETALRLLVEHLATLPPLPQHLDFLKSLSSTLAVDAFSACLRDQSPTNAVELLEQGRGVFWAQLTRLRSPLEDVITSAPEGKALADEFTRLTSLVRTVLHSPGPDQHDRIWSLNLELKKVVSNIRELPGLSRFLLPSLFSDLRHAARDGPVIIMNASKYGCDALVVFFDKDPVHIPLPITKKDVQELSSQLRTLTRSARTIGNDTEKEFMVFLRELWDRLVFHVVNILQTTCPRNLRIWWCPTAEFSLLPLHAAAPYRPHQKGLSDLYVSSYTTTLTALIRARRPSVSDSSHEKPRFIAIGQAAPKGGSELLCVGAELDTIGQLVDGPATFTRIEGEDACISRVADKLGKNELVHFACHGVPNQKQPFESAFALRDGEFTIQRISQCDLKNPKFAYLSACHTTVGDQENPDEMIHLASAMQFAGFRSVIGTMWGVDDSQTNKVISMFYKWMIDEKGRLDYTRAARALRMTMKKVDIPMDQRILYIHLGA